MHAYIHNAMNVNVEEWCTSIIQSYQYQWFAGHDELATIAAEAWTMVSWNPCMASSIHNQSDSESASLLDVLSLYTSDSDSGSR